MINMRITLGYNLETSFHHFYFMIITPSCDDGKYFFVCVDLRTKSGNLFILFLDPGLDFFL